MSNCLKCDYPHADLVHHPDCPKVTPPKPVDVTPEEMLAFGPPRDRETIARFVAQYEMLVEALGLVATCPPGMAHLMPLAAQAALAAIGARHE